MFSLSVLDGQKINGGIYPPLIYFSRPSWPGVGEQRLSNTRVLQICLSCRMVFSALLSLKILYSKGFKNVDS